MILHCLIDANPEPDIKWFHRFSDADNQEMDLSRQFSQENFNEQENKIWYIQNEQLNNTRWKTSLFIKVILRVIFIIIIILSIFSISQDVYSIRILSVVQKIVSVLMNNQSL